VFHPAWEFGADLDPPENDDSVLEIRHAPGRDHLSNLEPMTPAAEHVRENHGLAQPRPGRPTIYRNLERFLRCATTNHHHHIHCEQCQRATELDGCAMTKALSQLERQCGYKVTRHQLQVFGLCPECQKPSPEATTSSTPARR